MIPSRCLDRIKKFISLKVAELCKQGKQGVSQGVNAAEIGRGKMVILNSTGRSKEISSALSRVRQETGQSSTQKKDHHWCWEGLQKQRVFNGHASNNATKLPGWTLQGNTKRGTFKSRKKYSSLK